MNTTGTGPIGCSIPLIIDHATGTNIAFHSQKFATINATILIYRIRGNLNGNGCVYLENTAKTAYMVVKLTPDLVFHADFNNNGLINVGDTSMIARYRFGKISEL
ncbi:MAG: hypothetical protein STSR0009_16890 [Methanoregula sp.]